ncbi:DUF4055 domain-containing protein [Pseudomonas moorei]|uniref:Uncharacterized protein n=1 Tax=Pseudomonas moorei TaxID=395599 RepID=A0A1H1FIW2_9PSED|nr:DUF4055 domain-containing protein [Pseudomonas moorei]KAB0509673.1 DUF4055 domain-containing protein [Pseudomonas moorei]SDR00774.1 protein of unknown function [Pseudomonas moorei]
MSDDPSKTLPAVDAMREDWAIVDPLMGGTRAMREAGELLLPKWPKEEDCDYRKRLGLSTLFPAYRETVKNNTGRVFAEPIVLGEDVPPAVVDFTDDFDRQGNNLQVWAKSFFTQALSHGLCHALAEYPNIKPSGDTEQLVTLADARAVKARPYAIMIRPQQVVGWRVSNDGGEHVLTQFRYMESVEEEEGAFGIKCINQIRVLIPGAWMTYREQTDAKGMKTWALYDEGPTSLDHIPLTTLYTDRTGFMTAKPPLLELAYLNAKHWQSQSDQDNILHVARVPMLAISGIDDDTWELKVGTASATKLPKDGDMKWVEHTGASIEAGRTSLIDIEDQMRVAGAKLLQKETKSVKTATQAEEEAAQEMSPLQTMASGLEDALDQILQHFAELSGLPEGGHVQVQGNFDIDFAPETTLPLLLNMASQGRLSDETLFSEMQRRNVVSSDIKWEEEAAKIATQGPALGAL